MKYMTAILLALCLGLISGPAMADEITKFNVGKAIVIPIQDRAGTMKAEFFSGPLSAEERLALMPGGEAPSSVNIFLIQSEAGNILVDSGWGWTNAKQNDFPHKLRLAGLTEADIDYVILTHMHADHIGGLVNGPEAAFPKAAILVSEKELEYWSAQVEAARKENPEKEAPASIGQPVPAGRLQEAVLTTYEGRIKTFAFGNEILPGIRALEAVGHTPGHTAFRLSSGDAAMLFIGDLIHAAALQFQEPDECARYDMDAAQAVASRKAILNLASEENISVVGAHIPFSGLGRVKADGRRGFTFTPY